MMYFKITSVNEATFRLQQQNEKMTQALIKYYNQVKDLQEQKDDLARLNFVPIYEI